MKQPEMILDVFEMWQMAAEGAAGEVSFGTTAVPAEGEVALWRLDLPADPAGAAGQLAYLEAQVQAVEASLNRVPGRLDQLVRQVEGQSGGDLSFGPAFLNIDPATPEAELLRLVTELQRAGSGQVSFASGQTAANGWGQVKEQFQAALRRLLQLLTHLAWVETRQEGQLLGQTVVSWTGDTSTAWGTGHPPAQLVLHRRALTLALASRLTLLRTLVIAAQGATKIVPLIAMPGGVGALLALPVAWRYTNQVLAEIGRYQHIVQEN